MAILLFLHIFGSILFLGNILVTAFWKVFMDKEQGPQVIYETSKKVLLMDFIFTLPGVVLLVATGHIMASKLGYHMLELNWVSVSNWLIILTAVIWIVFLLPLQLRMIRLSRQAVSEGKVSDQYHRVYRIWMVYGSIATLIPIVILYLMVAKPF